MGCICEKTSHAPHFGGLLLIKHCALLQVPSGPVPQLGWQCWDLIPPVLSAGGSAALLPFLGDECLALGGDLAPDATLATQA